MQFSKALLALITVSSLLVVPARASEQQALNQEEISQELQIFYDLYSSVSESCAHEVLAQQEEEFLTTLHRYFTDSMSAIENSAESRTACVTCCKNIIETLFRCQDILEFHPMEAADIVLNYTIMRSFPSFINAKGASLIKNDQDKAVLINALQTLMHDVSASLTENPSEN